MALGWKGRFAEHQVGSASWKSGLAVPSPEVVADPMLDASPGPWEAFKKNVGGIKSGDTLQAMH